MIGMVQPYEGDERTVDVCTVSDRLRGTHNLVVSETEDGRYLIVLAGVTRFMPGEEMQGFTPYRRVQANWTPFHDDLRPIAPDEGFDRPAFLQVLEKYFETSGLSTDWDSLQEADEETLVNSLAMLCPYSAEEKQALLEGGNAGRTPRQPDRAYGIRHRQPWRRRIAAIGIAP